MSILAPPRALAGWHRLRPWSGTTARLGLAAVWLVAGAAKVGDPAATGRAVHAYELTPYAASSLIGTALPFVELALGALLLAGLATRLVAVISAGLLTAFVAVIASAWARGLAIDCGCFGSGGELPAGVAPSYLPEIGKNVLFLGLAAYLLTFPVTRLSIDALLDARPRSGNR